MYAFVHIDKTAGSTLNTILRRSFGTRHCDIRLPLVKRRDDGSDHRASIEAADVQRVQRLYRNLRGIAGHNVKAYADLPAAFPDIQFMTILRNPVSRFRSQFLNRATSYGPDELERWLASPSYHNWQTRMIAGEPDAQQAIELLSTRFGFVGLTERFDESLLMLADWLSDTEFQPKYRPVNQIIEKRRSRDVLREQTDLSYLDADSVRTRMQEVNAEDQKVYDFVAANIYPEQRARYQGDLAAELQSFQQQNREPGRLAEPLSGSFLRNYVYKPLIHCYVL
jgi:hypothetical protein